MNTYGIRPNRRRGQNFLADPSIAQHFVDTIEAPAAEGIAPSLVVEIGPGLGAITRFLSARFERVIALETDRRIVKLWGNTIECPENVRIIEADATQFDYSALAKESGGRIIVVGNLPYNVSTIILLRLLHNWRHVAQAHLTFQKEVADRLLAKPGSKAYGALTVQRQIYADAIKRMGIPKEGFAPRPKVHSTVVGLRIHAEPSVGEAAAPLFETFVRHLFLYRRKTVSNSLKKTAQFAPWSRWFDAFCNENKISVGCRADGLSFDQLFALFQFCQQKESAA